MPRNLRAGSFLATVALCFSMEITCAQSVVGRPPNVLLIVSDWRHGLESDAGEEAEKWCGLITEGAAQRRGKSVLFEARAVNELEPIAEIDFEQSLLERLT